MKLIRKYPLPSPMKMWKRAAYEIMWGAKPRDYGKYVGQKKTKKK